ncbi:hypothetical protein Tco_0751600 [Tanacetum coccineum]|uniref:Reverse transcriptase domain-containing protein n=1 Tax=Tanacetum coccineum TaxID=301880 RepID=A0ABQ4Z4G9_9ASTR
MLASRLKLVPIIDPLSLEKNWTRVLICNDFIYLTKLHQLTIVNTDSFLALEDDPTSSEVDPTYQDPEGDILILEAILNSEPPPPLPNHEQYMPEVRKELKLCEAKTIEPSIDEPPEVELKELPPHLEYAFLEGDNKLPVIIANPNYLLDITLV